MASSSSISDAKAMARRRPGTTPMLRAIASAALAAAVILPVTWELLINSRRMAFADFLADSWYVQHQSLALTQGHAPSLFLHADAGVFYPVYAFYGGTLFVAGGAIAAITGSAQIAQVILYVLALA